MAIGHTNLLARRLLQMRSGRLELHDHGSAAIHLTNQRRDLRFSLGKLSCFMHVPVADFGNTRVEALTGRRGKFGDLPRRALLEFDQAGTNPRQLLLAAILVEERMEERIKSATCMNDLQKVLPLCLGYALHRLGSGQFIDDVTAVAVGGDAAPRDQDLDGVNPAVDHAHTVAAPMREGFLLRYQPSSLRPAD